MASTLPIQIADDGDEDDFDWEAAVREIDIACQNTKPFTSLSNGSFSHQFTTSETPLGDCNANTNVPFSNSLEKPVISRQSTLDKFIGKEGLKPQLKDQVGSERNEVPIDVGDDERMSCIDIDPQTATTWIYPVNIPLRDYQFAITKTALFSNTLVALPTGLGKTLIAAVIMYNYFRWFPEGKIVFAAPSRPLVMQQIEACHKIVGIPQEWTIDLTGQTSPTKRACFWKTKRVFFVTPQVLEKDIQSGTCLVKYLVCLVIDEAHRAMGNYSYCVAVRELMAVPVQLRILALTATPGSKQQTIQHIIDNLNISKLEYRNESDEDVSPYVHNRKTELIEVPMGKDADEINNKLSEVIRPFLARLCAAGVMQNRDYQTLSPCDFLNSRDKFRRAPPPNLPQNMDVEGYFGVLITLYHIRKLLSSHGIRPAYEMLEEKLRQGYFARLISRNEDIKKAKILMQQNLTHGAPSPKLSKLLEVLIDHFKTKGPQNSRVIIFSNFRGSVRDIMDALAKIGDLVKATEFIGQSSGKSLKGQSQKVQQAVLEKFRAGGYNVIVATSIGEEGLDIMEVDLVICFDANVSPLRMIQRMGRTGRKNDGRVVILASEGSELRGYMRKQANSKAVKKHMRNGGIHSFNFHSSPRMIPHIFKPEVQFVEISIEQFIHRGKKVKDDQTIQTPTFEEELNVTETDLINKYFQHAGESTRRPSLIAFPHFQAFPSRVHKIKHSYRTGMLIDTMQCLQGLSFSRDSTDFIEDVVSPQKCLGVLEQHANDTKDTTSQREVLDCELSPRGTLKTRVEHSVVNITAQSSLMHSYLFGSDFVSIDALGKVQILSVPVLPIIEVSHSRCMSGNSTLNCLQQASCHLRTSSEDCKELTEQVKVVANLATSRMRRINNITLPTSTVSSAEKVKTLDGVENVPGTPILKGNLSNERDRVGEIPGLVNIKASLLPGDDFGDTEFSPRLTNLIKSGVVPESPINDDGLSSDERSHKIFAPDQVTPAKSRADLLSKFSSSGENEKVVMGNGEWGRDIPVSPTDNKIENPLEKLKNGACARTPTSLIVEEAQTPLANLTNNSCSKDWLPSSGEKSCSVQQAPKFKRLRKLGDCGKNRPPKAMKENNGIPLVDHVRPFSKTGLIRNKHGRGKKMSADDARVFIEEEAEVSSEAEVSDDEEDELDSNSNDDSFIDDRINPTTASTQAEDSRTDMMAVYRRSLLSQSPMVRHPNASLTPTPDSLAPTTRARETEGSSGLQTPATESTNQSAGRTSNSFPTDPEKISAEAIPCTTDGTKMESRKRKLSYYQSRPVPAINLETKFSLESSQQDIDPNMEDDQFYEGLDLDAVEAQATLLLKQSKMSSIQEQEIIPRQNVQTPDFQCSPSFDLGI